MMGKARQLRNLMLIGILVCVLLAVGCTKSSKIQEVPAPRVELGQHPLKEWDEALYRLPQAEHRAHIANLSQKYPGVLYYKGASTAGKRVALTFDDGPDNFYTPQILAILKGKAVSATFFMVGKEVQRYPMIAKTIADHGHTIGNHSWDHPRLPLLTEAKLTQEIKLTEQVILAATGRKTDLFRPPYGLAHEREMDLLRSLGYRVIDWSVDTTDWKGNSKAGILNLVQKEVSPGAIILQHCLAGKPGELNGTVQALPEIIDRLKAQGYQFVTVPTLLQK